MAKTYKDIQAMTGLSLSTISKYFNGGALKDGNRALIEQAIQKLDYRVNPFAQGLKSKRSRRVGILIPELTSTYHTFVTSEVCYHLRQAGYDTVVCDAHLDREIERDALNFLLDRMVDGIITIPHWTTTGESLLKAQERRVPVVLVDQLLRGLQVGRGDRGQRGRGCDGGEGAARKGTPAHRADHRPSRDLHDARAHQGLSVAADARGASPTRRRSPGRSSSTSTAATIPRCR